MKNRSKFGTKVQHLSMLVACKVTGWFFLIICSRADWYESRIKPLNRHYYARLPVALTTRLPYLKSKWSRSWRDVIILEVNSCWRRESFFKHFITAKVSRCGYLRSDWQ